MYESDVNDTRNKTMSIIHPIVLTLTVGTCKQTAKTFTYPKPREPLRPAEYSGLVERRDKYIIIVGVNEESKQHNNQTQQK